MSEVAMIACLWMGFWIGNRHGTSKASPVVLQLKEAALRIKTRSKFMGDGDFVPTYTATMTVEGDNYMLAVMEEKPGRSFVVSQTIHA